MALKDNQGFTMVEVLLAMAIFLIGFLAVGSMQISAVNSNASARMRTAASLIASQQAERLLALPFSDLDATVAADYPMDQGPYTIAQPTLTTRTGGELTATNNRIVNVTVQWMQRGRNRSVTYTVMAVNM